MYWRGKRGISEPVGGGGGRGQVLPRQKDWITGEDKLSNQYDEQ